MKVTMNIECTPEEARAFLGLPDVTALQQDMLEKMRAQMEKAADPEAMMKALFPQAESLAEMQKAFWAQFTQAGGKADK